MAQVKWVQTYLDDESCCNVRENGVLCGTKLGKRASTVKNHITVKHPPLFNEITGQANLDNVDALTLLATCIGTSTAAVSILKNKAFNVSISCGKTDLLFNLYADEESSRFLFLTMILVNNYGHGSIFI